MFRRTIAALALTLLVSSSAGAWGLRYSIVNMVQYPDLGGGSDDFDGDGVPDLCFMTEISGAYQFTVLNPDGTTRWQYVIGNILGAPDQHWWAQFLGFGNLDPLPGREVLFGVYANHEDDPWSYDCAFRVVNAESNSVTWSHSSPTFVYNRDCTQPVALDVDGMDEIVIELESGMGTNRYEVWGFSTPDAIGDQTTPGASNVQIRPNPVSSSTSIDFGVSTATSVSVQVVDVAGRLVRDLIDAPYSTGPHSIQWDGTDGEGHPVASGAYYARIRVGNQIESRSLVITR